MGLQEGQVLRRSFEGALNTRYLLYLPGSYEQEVEQRWPLILFLHGAAERGTDLEKLKTQGLPKLLQKGEDFPFLVLIPQCLPGVRWRVDLLGELLDEFVQSYRVDEDRIYVTGMSMGGFATWELAMTFPQRFAAIAPICGGGNLGTVAAIRHLPVWAFHGALDRVVPLEYAETIVRRLEQCGGNVRLTIYPRGGHDSWTQTYANPELYKWFLAQRRS
uniref:Phospholipase/carboxylesterase/thioesterase domain-containing protein n=1 Tax=Thermosporothrix sp. COM3 TaxID=2490863 RepID=A0A455SMW6_9CHLR|nr:hypothetical protein KTC_30130 [Thermosporothrix sp. COM3]